MQKTDHSRLDFRSLEILKRVHDRGSVSAVAAEIGQNQSSVSYTLNRLREAFGDPLFVRSGRGVEPTVRCREIVEAAGDILDRMEGLFRAPAFDPATSDETVGISCNHYERSVLIPPIARRMARDAPGIRLRVLQSLLQGHRQLSAGECDILLSPRRAESDTLFQQRLLEDRFVCVMDADHPLARGTITLERYGNCRHAALTREGGWRPLYMDSLAAEGVGIDIAVEMPSPADLVDFIGGTDLVLTMLSRLARGVGGNMRVRESPFDIEVAIFQFWTTRTHWSPAYRWVRNVVSEVAQEIRAQRMPTQAR